MPRGRTGLVASVVLAVGLLFTDGPHTACHALPQDGGVRASPPYWPAAAGPHGSGPGFGTSTVLRRLPVGASASPRLRLRGGSEYMSSASLLAQNPEMAKSLMSSKLVSKTRMYGFIVLGLGLVFSTLGFMFFFNRTLIGTGNLLTIGGVVLIAGYERAYAFLAQRERSRGSGIFLFGVFLVLRGRARLGVLVEIFGILNLFGNFLPSVLNIIKSIPGVGPALTPIIESEAVSNAVAFISKYAAPKQTAEDEEPLPPPPMPPPDLPAASTSTFSSIYSMFSFSSSTHGTATAAHKKAYAAPRPLRETYSAGYNSGGYAPAASGWAVDEPEMPPPADDDGAPPPYMG